MRQPCGFVCKFVRLCAFLFLISGSTARGQVRPRVVEAVNNDRRITLKRNVHPLARAEFDRGAVIESQPMTRMLLLLNRGDDQEAALQQYLDSQQEKLAELSRVVDADGIWDELRAGGCRCSGGDGLADEPGIHGGKGIQR